jgi:hypothetical protein
VSETPDRISRAELEAEAGTALPAKEVISLLDLNVDADLALALAAPIDLAVAANAQAALPIDASVSANILSFFSNATAVANQGATITQVMNGVDASADAIQTASVDQTDGGSDDGNGDTEQFGALATAGSTEDDLLDGDVDLGGTVDDLQGAVDDLRGAIGDLEGVTSELDGITQQLGDTVDQLGETVGEVTSELGGALDNALADGLLKVDVNVALDADLAAPIAGAVAANAQVAAPIDAAVAANIGSIDSEAIAIADQTAVITQVMEDVTASATADQDADVSQ